MDEGDLTVVAVLSGNRNFEGRIHPQVRASLPGVAAAVVAYALAGRVDVDLTTRAARRRRRRVPGVPRATSGRRRTRCARRVGGRDRPRAVRARVRPRSSTATSTGAGCATPTGLVYAWDAASTYVREPPFFQDARRPNPPGRHRGRPRAGEGRRLDHHRPHLAGRLDQGGLTGRAVPPSSTAWSRGDFNSYGARRGNHEVMMRGTFANIRLRNELAPGTEGPWTTHLPSGEVMTIFDASERYRDEGVPLARAGRQGVRERFVPRLGGEGPAAARRAVRASPRAYERIHRSNLVGMGIVPLQFRDGGLGGDARPHRRRGALGARARAAGSRRART